MTHTNAEIEALKAKAEAATAGPWEHQDINLSDDIDRGCCFVVASSGGLIAGALPWPTELYTAKYDRVLANGEFIAAANPETIIALITENAALQACTPQPSVQGLVDALKRIATLEQYTFKVSSHGAEPILYDHQKLARAALAAYEKSLRNGRDLGR